MSKIPPAVFSSAHTAPVPAGNRKATFYLPEEVIAAIEEYQFAARRGGVRVDKSRLVSIALTTMFETYPHVLLDELRRAA